MKIYWTSQAPSYTENREFWKYSDFADWVNELSWNEETVPAFSLQRSNIRVRLPDAARYCKYGDVYYFAKPANNFGPASGYGNFELEIDFVNTLKIFSENQSPVLGSSIQTRGHAFQFTGSYQADGCEYAIGEICESQYPEYDSDFVIVLLCTVAHGTLLSGATGSYMPVILGYKSESHWSVFEAVSVAQEITRLNELHYSGSDYGFAVSGAYVFPKSLIVNILPPSTATNVAFYARGTTTPIWSGYCATIGRQTTTYSLNQETAPFFEDQSYSVGVASKIIDLPSRHQAYPLSVYVTLNIGSGIGVQLYMYVNGMQFDITESITIPAHMVDTDAIGKQNDAKMIASAGSAVGTAIAIAGNLAAHNYVGAGASLMMGATNIAQNLSTSMTLPASSIGLTITSGSFEDLTVGGNGLIRVYTRANSNGIAFQNRYYGPYGCSTVDWGSMMRSSLDRQFIQGDFKFDKSSPIASWFYNDLCDLFAKGVFVVRGPYG